MSKAGVGREKRKRVSDDEDDKEREVAQRGMLEYTPQLTEISALAQLHCIHVY